MANKYPYHVQKIHVKYYKPNGNTNFADWHYLGLNRKSQHVICQRVFDLPGTGCDCIQFVVIGQDKIVAIDKIVKLHEILHWPDGQNLTCGIWLSAKQMKDAKLFAWGTVHGQMKHRKIISQRAIKDLRYQHQHAFKRDYGELIREHVIDKKGFYIGYRNKRFNWHDFAWWWQAET